MDKVVRIFSIMIIIVALCSVCFAANPYNASLDSLKDKLSEEATNVKMDDLQTKAGRVVRAIRNISAVVAAVVVSILGIKYMMGSTQERADYKKSFIPLIVGIAVVVAAASIATAIFSVAS